MRIQNPLSKMFSKINEINRNYRIQHQLTEDFLTQLDCDHMPTPAEFFCFLEQHQLGCFIDKKQLIKWIRNTDPETKKIDHIFCLPLGAMISEAFIEELSKLIASENANIILYFPFKLSDEDSYAPLRFSLMIQNKNIEIKTEALSLNGSRYAVDATQQLINGLKTKENLKAFSILQAASSAVLEEGDSLYRTNLRLLMRLSQDSVQWRPAFINWQQKNQSRSLILLDSILSSVSFLHTPLFFGEQLAAILKMGLQKKTLRHEFVVAIRIWRLIALCQLILLRDYLLSLTIFIIVGFQFLTLFFTRKMTDGFYKNATGQIFNLLSIGARLFATAYVNVPGTEIQRAIIVPRYVFEWLNNMMQEVIKLPIRLFGMTVIMNLMWFFASKKAQENRDNQVGVLAVAQLTMFVIIAFIQQFLLQFNSWIIPQKSEEIILSITNAAGESWYQLDVKTPYFTRIYQMLFSNQQQIALRFHHINADIQCDLKIMHDTARKCGNAQLDCWSRFFVGNSDSQMAVAPPPAEATHAPMKWQICQSE